MFECFLAERRSGLADTGFEKRIDQNIMLNEKLTKLGLDVDVESIRPQFGASDKKNRPGSKKNSVKTGWATLRNQFKNATTTAEPDDEIGSPTFVSSTSSTDNPADSKFRERLAGFTGTPKGIPKIDIPLRSKLVSSDSKAISAPSKPIIEPLPLDQSEKIPLPIKDKSMLSPRSAVPLFIKRQVRPASERISTTPFDPSEILSYSKTNNSNSKTSITKTPPPVPSKPIVTARTPPIVRAIPNRGTGVRGGTQNIRGRGSIPPRGGVRGHPLRGNSRGSSGAIRRPLPQPRGQVPRRKQTPATSLPSSPLSSPRPLPKVPESDSRLKRGNTLPIIERS